MERLTQFLKSLNFYQWAIIVFIAFNAFLDKGNVFQQLIEYRKLQVIKEEKLDFDRKTKALEKEQKETFGTKEATEAFAREKYLMKKPTETVFVIVDKDNQMIEK
jgi:cell division protein DivIC